MGRLTDNDNTKATVYSAFTVILPLAGLGYLLAPNATLTAVFGSSGGDTDALLWKLIGGGLTLLLPTITFTLKVLFYRLLLPSVGDPWKQASSTHPACRTVDCSAPSFSTSLRLLSG